MPTARDKLRRAEDLLAEAREAAVDRRLWLTILAAQLLGEIINDLAAAVADPGAADETDVTDKP